MKCHKVKATMVLHMPLNVELPIIKLAISVLKVRNRVNVPANVKAIYHMIMDDRRISAKSIATYV